MREGGNVKGKGCKALGIYVLLHAHNIYISINIATTYALLHTHNTSEGTHKRYYPEVDFAFKRLATEEKKDRFGNGERKN